MTKTSKTAVQPEAMVTLAVQAPAVITAANAANMPAAIELVGPIASVLEQVTALSRLGFTVNADAMPTMYASTGTAIITMMHGDPNPMMVAAATQALNDALALEEFAVLDAEKRAAVVVKEQEEQAVKAAAKAVIEAQIMTHQQSLRQLQATLAAA
jgi:hypothetical protein